MAALTQSEVLALLAAENPARRSTDLHVYADALRVYCEAADNVARLGAVVLHPKTASPLENPYLKVQERNGKLLREMRGITAEKTMAAIVARLADANSEREQEPGRKTGGDG